MNELVVVNNVRGYVENEIAYLNLEDVARGLGFEKTELKNGKEYKSIRWARIYDYLNISNKPEYITQSQLQKLIQNTNRIVDNKWYELAGLKRILLY